MDSQAVGIRTDIIEDGVEVSFVGYNLIIETIFKYMICSCSGIDGIFESRYKETKMLRESGLHPNQHMHMIRHNYILLCAKRRMKLGYVIEFICDYAPYP